MFAFAVASYVASDTDRCLLFFFFLFAFIYASSTFYSLKFLVVISPTPHKLLLYSTAIWIFRLLSTETTILTT